MLFSNYSLIPDYKASLIIKGYNGNDLTEKEDEQNQSLLKQMRSSKHTLSCSCFALTIGNRKARYYVRKPANNDHNEDCVLINKIRSERVEPNRPPLNDDTSIDLMSGTGVSTPSSKPSGSSSSGRSRKSLSKLISAIFYLFEKAGTNKGLTNKREFMGTVQAIKRAASNIPISSCSTIKLDSVLQIAAPFCDKNEIKKALKEKPLNWPESSTFHNLVLVPCDKIEISNKNGLTLSNKKQDGDEYYPVAEFAHGNAKTKKILPKSIGNQTRAHGPFLFALVLTLQTFKNKNGENIEYLKIEDCGFSYIDNRSNMCLLESTYERAMLWALNKIRTEDSRQFSIDKPIYNIENSRPDFVINNDNGRFVIEVAGIDSEEYRERKEKMHPVMSKEIGKVFEFDATDLNSPFRDSICWLKDTVFKK